MLKEGEKIMKGSLHEDDFFIVPDTLRLVTEKTAIIGIKKISTYIN